VITFSTICLANNPCPIDPKIPTTPRIIKVIEVHLSLFELLSTAAVHSWSLVFSS
jgi:hypothetical protein